MSLTVYAENMGLFHKGSGGTGVAPADVCLSPPPAPTGPAPIPYINNLSAADLAKGSKTVKCDGEPTALEDLSEVSTSTGDEAGNQGGNVVTHKTKGKGYFTLWSFTVQIEGKGVCRHGDMMGQASASSPPGTVNAAAKVKYKLSLGDKAGLRCDVPYNRHNGDYGPPPEHDSAQRKACYGKKCWECFERGIVKVDSGLLDPQNFIPDHQPPLKVAWEMGGCHDPEAFEKWAQSEDAVLPHCQKCSGPGRNDSGELSQMNKMARLTAAEIRGWD
jgi:uncharacterized Zn-binding protein involved in type VI secretion